MADLAEIEAELQARLQALDAEDDLGRVGQKPVMLDQQSVGRLSRMDALQQQAMAQATAQRRDQERLRIRAALERLKEGEYGFCTDCGEPVEPKRISFDPSQPLCLSCARG